MRPMAQGEANPLLEHFARIPAADCFVLPFEKIANRSFTDDPSGVRGWTGAGLPDFRQGFFCCGKARPKIQTRHFPVPSGQLERMRKTSHSRCS